MKYIIILLFWLSCINAHAPTLDCLYIIKSHPISKFDILIKAIGYVESKEDTLCYNRQEDAIGYFQIRKILLDDYNQRTGSNYVHTDMYDYFKAKKVFLYYAVKYNDYEMIAKRWNGRGRMTENYWNKVKKRL
jgi:hypothetical protein